MEILKNPNVDFSRYNAIYVESVSFWRSTETAKLDPETSQMLSEYFYAALVREIGKVANVANAPGPGVARLRVAFLDAKGANVSGRVVTTVAPQLRILTAAGGMATDTAATVGEIGMAAKLTDSMTDQVLATAADRRLGQKTFSGMTDKWSDAKDAIDIWAKDFAQHWQQFVGGARR